MMKSRLFVFALIAIAAISQALADETLFGSDATLELTITADWEALSRDRDEKNNRYRAGQLTIADGAGAMRSFEVGLKSRGLSRLTMGMCNFSQLFVRFEESDRSETPFADQQVVPLVTHCKSSARYEQYLLQEFLAYRTYRLLTDISLRTRLARITYVDANEQRKNLVRHAFFVEHFDQLAERLVRDIASIGDFDPLVANSYDMGLMDVFQFMIGNTDWSVVHQHNVLLLRGTDGEIAPLPFDFDWTGVVDASYAYPGDEIRINSVRQRLYRGVCLEPETMQKVFSRFAATKEQIYELYQHQGELARGQLKKTLRYYDDFYEILATPGERQKKILDACRRLQ